MSEKARLVPQIHLSTAILTMFFAGAMIWLNVDDGRQFIDAPLEDGSGKQTGYYVGWPFVFGVYRQKPTPELQHFDSFDFVVDIIACLGWTILIAVTFEFLMRRLDASRPAEVKK